MLDLNILPETKTNVTSQQCRIEILLAHTLNRIPFKPPQPPSFIHILFFVLLWSRFLFTIITSEDAFRKDYKQERLREFRLTSLR